MNMKLGVATVEAIDRRIGQKMADVAGRHPTEYTEDLICMSQSLSELSEELLEIANDAEGSIEKAHIRRGVSMCGDILDEGQITAHRHELGHFWVATVSCECVIGEFCNTCGPDVLPSIKTAVAKFLDS